MTLLPRIDSFEDYKPLYTQSEPWLPAVRAICERHGLDAGDLRRAGFGTHVVFFTGDRVIKLFCRLWPEDFVCERAVLANVI
ncbi:MAG: hypothetical protein OER88_08165, partial [Planctomycetota bacterium]|nr:hypothetical protein [Planctomycetota bacterium]